jgi:DNA-binding NarL/FixJ family response regulator
MKIAILDDSKTFLSYITKQLQKLNFKDIHTFECKDVFYEYISENKDIDVVFIDYHLKKTDGFEVIEYVKKLLPDTYKVMITSDTTPSLKEKALNVGFDTFLEKNISFIDLQALMTMIKTLRKYVKKEIEKKESFKKLLEYKEMQEKIIHQKQNKIMKNELEMYFDENFLFEIYFQPKDLLTGDTIYTKKLSKNEYFIAIIDAMGKGLGASLTSFNALAFLKHSISKAIEYHDFNYKKLINDFINYLKSILLENEILCATLVYIQNGQFHYANFGNPPILASSGVIKANNAPIRIATSDFKIDTIKTEEKILISSDGIFESPYKNSIYYKRLKELFPKTTFLKEIIEDFRENSEQTDDMSVIFITKENKNFELVYEDSLYLEREEIDTFFNKFVTLNIPKIEQINLILHEILMNTYEYGVLQIENKEKIKMNKEKIYVKNKENKKIFAKIKLYKNEEWIKIEYEDNSDGFDVQKIKDAYYKKYHGRGIKIIKHLSDGLFFNENGTAIKIFVKAEQ